MAASAPTAEHTTLSTTAKPKNEPLASAGMARYAMAAGIGFVLGILFSIAVVCCVRRNNNKAMYLVSSQKNNSSLALRGSEASAELMNILPMLSESKKVDDNCTSVLVNDTHSINGLTEQSNGKHKERIEEHEGFENEADTSKVFFAKETHFTGEG